MHNFLELRSHKQALQSSSQQLPAALARLCVYSEDLMDSEVVKRLDVHFFVCFNVKIYIYCPRCYSWEREMGCSGAQIIAMIFVRSSSAWHDAGDVQAFYKLHIRRSAKNWNQSDY